MAWFKTLTGFGGRDMAVDLGTCSTLVHVRGKGVVLYEPSVVAIEKGTNGSSPSGPTRKDALADPRGHRRGPPAAGRRHRGLRDDGEDDPLLHREGPDRWLIKPRMVIGVPSGITEVEKRAVRESAEQAGARDPVYLIEESMAASIGADIPLRAGRHMICDIGGGTTEISVISLGGMVVSNTIRIGGDEFDEAIIKHVRNVHNLLRIGEQTSETLKMTIGNAISDGQIEKDGDQGGRDAITGSSPRIEVELGRGAARPSQGPINAVIDEVKRTLGQTPPELAADIVERGIVMSGGGSLLKGLPKLIAKETGVPVHPGGEPDDVRGRRLRALARGVRRDPPQQSQPRAPERPAPLLVSAQASESAHADSDARKDP